MRSIKLAPAVGKRLCIEACFVPGETETAAHTGNWWACRFNTKSKISPKAIYASSNATGRHQRRIDLDRASDGFSSQKHLLTDGVVAHCFFLKKRGNPRLFEQFNRLEDVHSQVGIRRWFVLQP